MEFREAMERYRAGTASPEEQALVEAELEKSRLIAEYELEQMEPLPEPEETSEEPLRKIRISLRRRNRRLALAAAVLAVVLLLLANWGILPLFDAFFFDPEQSTICEDASDFDLIMKYQLELHRPGAGYFGSHVERTGIGRYEIDLDLYNPIHGNSLVEAVLDKDKLTLSNAFAQDGYVPVLNLFDRNTVGLGEDWRGEETGRFLEKLQTLPDYIAVTAAVSFGENLTMKELLALKERHPEVTFWWAGVECSANAPCGLALDQYGAGYGEGPNALYPALEVYWENGISNQAELYEAHFKSMLRLMADHPDLASMLGGFNYANYPTVLREVEEQGVMIYGVYVSAAPSDLLALMEEEITTFLWLRSAEITLY